MNTELQMFSLLYNQKLYYQILYKPFAYVQHQSELFINALKQKKTIVKK